MSVRALRSAAVAATALAILVFTLTATAQTAGAVTPPVGLGTATSYAVLAGSTITNTGNSVLHGDRGLSPGTDVTGFPPGLLDGTPHTADAEALQAKSDLTTAYVDAAGRTPATSVPAELGGSTFGPGTYVGATLQLTGSVTLDAGGDPDAVFLFKTNSTLITASNSSVILIGSANPCNIFWQVSSSATLGTGTALVGTVMADASITANHGADVVGRLLARTGAVTLDQNVLTRPTCAFLPPGSTTTQPVTSTTGASVTTTTDGATTTGPVATTVTSTTTPPVSTTTPPVSTTSLSVSTTTLAASTTTGVQVTVPSTLVNEATTTTSGPAATTSTTGPSPFVWTTTRPDQTQVSVAREGTTTTVRTSTSVPAITTGTLARTGSNPGGQVALGLLALGAGLGILAVRRRTITG